MLRLRRFLMHHFICVFNGNAYIILINSDFQKKKTSKNKCKTSTYWRHLNAMRS